LGAAIEAASGKKTSNANSLRTFYAQNEPEAHAATLVIHDEHATNEEKVTAYNTLLRTVLTRSEGHNDGHLSASRIIECLGLDQIDRREYCKRRSNGSHNFSSRNWGMKQLKELQSEGVILKRSIGYHVEIASVRAYVQRQIEALGGTVAIQRPMPGNVICISTAAAWKGYAN
jgi:hypothetical protein